MITRGNREETIAESMEESVKEKQECMENNEESMMNKQSKNNRVKLAAGKERITNKDRE